MFPTAVINIVGLTSELIGDATPNLAALVREGRLQRLRPVLPAVTCSVQSSMLTGLRPREHGIVGNGWYDRQLAEVQFWKQSNRLVRGPKVWETALELDPSLTCATMFWWYNMYSTADWSVTPRPIYKADGRKIPDCYSHPADLRDVLQERLGTFPLFHFWGPASSIVSSRWIADASKIVHELKSPTLMLVYLPHLDYGLQQLGPEHPGIAAELTRIDEVFGDLLQFFRQRDVRVIVLSEYGIEPVDKAIPINLRLRQSGALKVRREQGLELLDPGASRVFAVVDHQVAHLYIDQPGHVRPFSRWARELEGVELILERADQAEYGIDHERAGEIVLVARPGYWFTYDYWLDEACAPDFARTVDIHRKPGYDPRELFFDPRISLLKPRLAWKLLRKKLGFRQLMDVIPLDTSLVRGSHGRVDQPRERQPVLLTTRAPDDQPAELPCTAVRDVILEHLFTA